MAIQLKKLLSEGIDRVRNSTTLDEKAANFFRPQTGTLATYGRNTYNKFASQPLSPRVQYGTDVVFGGLQGLKQGFAAQTGIEKKLPGNYDYQPVTKAAKVAQFAGNAVGYGLGPGKILGPIEKAAGVAVKIPQLAKTAPIVNKVANFIARKTLPTIISESASAIPTAVIKSRVDGSNVVQDYAENLVGGLAGRGVAKGVDVAAPLVKKAGTQAVQAGKQAVKETERQTFENFLNNALQEEKRVVAQLGEQKRNKVGQFGSKQKVRTLIGGDVVDERIPLLRLIDENGQEKIIPPSRLVKEPNLVQYVQGPYNGPASFVHRQTVSGGFIKPSEFIPGQKVLGTRPQNTEGITVGKQESASFGKDVLSSEIGAQKVPNPLLQQKIPQSNTGLNTQLKGQGAVTPSDRIIQDAQKEIGTLKEEKLPFKQKVSETWDRFYTDWVDRYHPIAKATQQVENLGKKQGFELRPENNPKYVLRRFAGMGGIAEQRYEAELKPVLDTVDKLGISRGELDVYLKAKRDINLATRGIRGSDANLATQRVQALQGKYGQNLDAIAQKMYSYQAKGFQELVDSGFISPDQAKGIQELNQNYVPFQRIMDQVDEFLGMPTKKAMQGTNPINKIQGSDKQIYSPVESIIANTYKQRAAIEKNKVARAVADLGKADPSLGFATVKKAGTDTISVWRNGQKEYVRVGQDIAESMKGMNEEQMNNVLKLFTGPASLLRQGATGRNPEFMLPNVLRDQQDAAVNAKYGYTPLVDYAKSIASIFKNDALYQEWKSSGGAQSFSAISGRKGISEMLDEKQSKKRLFSWLSKGLDVMGKYSEEPTRLGLYRRAKDATGNKMIAAYESREGTMDFARMGAKMKVANSIIPFLNVSVQGFDKVVRNAKSNPAQFALRMSLYAALPQATVTAYNLAFHPDEYQEVPQYEKDGNFVIVNGRNEDGTINYFTIPKGNVAQLGANPVDQFMTFAAGKNSATIGQFMTQFLSSTIPTLSEGQSPKEVAIKSIGSNLPQAIKPLTENLLNKSFYKYNPDKEQSKEIVPQYLQKKAPGDQSYEWTPTAYKAIGKIAGVSPLQVQNLAEGYLAGYAKIPVQIVESLKNVSDGKSIDINQRTILRRFFKQTYPESGSEKKVQAKPSPLISQAAASEAMPQTTLAKQFAQKQDISTLEQKYFNLTDDQRKEIKNLDDKSGLSDSQLVGYYLGKEINLPKSNRYEQVIRTNKILSKLDDIEKAASVSDTQKQRLKDILVKKAGFTKDDFSYYEISKQNNNEKTLYVLDQLDKVTDKKQLFKTMASWRKSVNGNMVLSNGVVDNLVDEGYLTKDQAKALKKISYDTKTGKLKTSSGGSFITKSELKASYLRALKASMGDQPEVRSTKKLSDYYASRRRSFKLI